MKYAWTASALLAAAGTVAAQSSDCTETAGNYYCSQVDAISYSNFGTAGQYQQVTYMGDQGQCDFQAVSYQGGMAPFDSEVSWHFRGPIQLKQFAFYTLGSSQSKRSYHPSPHVGRYAHQHIHRQQQEAREAQENSAADVEKRGVGDWTDVTMDGNVVSWTNRWGGQGDTPTPTTPSQTWVTATIDGKIVSWLNNYFGAAATSLQTVVSTSQAASAVAASPAASSPETSSLAASAVAASPATSSPETSSLAASAVASSPAASSPATESPVASSVVISSIAAPTASSSSLAASSPTTESSSVPVYQTSSSSAAASPVSSSSSGSLAGASSSASTAGLISTASSAGSSTLTSGSGSSASSAAATISAGAGQWARQAYYNAEEGEASGLVFLNHNGGEGSGVFDTVWGASLSYASADNSEGVASPVTLADTLVGDNSEFVIMTDKSCSDGTCGTYRNGTVAYHGFDGASKLFLLEFSMPLSGKTGFNADMPAVWMLNAQIPRTEQYGNCSCWESGCGEFDIFEVLDSGDEKTKSTWHGVNSLGDSDYFARPTSGTMKAAVVLDGSSSTAHIIVLDDSTSFDSTLTESTVAGYLSSITDSSLSIETALPG